MLGKRALIWILQEIRKSDHSLFERGRGNVCSVEFNCLYRWHATTSEQDEAWVHQVFEKIFPGKTPDEVALPHLTVNDLAH